MKKEIINKKISLISEHLIDLKIMSKNDFSQFKKSKKDKKFTEKLLQEIIEACIDIGNHIIAYQGLGTPASNYEVFQILANNKIIENGKKLDEYKKMTAYRNIIVHNYDDVDDEITYGIIKKKLVFIENYVKEINKYIK